VSDFSSGEVTEMLEESTGWSTTLLEK
jgi:hypothetical protein